MPRRADAKKLRHLPWRNVTVSLRPCLATFLSPPLAPLRLGSSNQNPWHAGRRVVFLVFLYFFRIVEIRALFVAMLPEFKTWNLDAGFLEEVDMQKKFGGLKYSDPYDMTDARDIARRFEQLETQWMSFLKKSAKLERDKDILEKSTTSSHRNQLSKYAASSAASSYSNPLFMNHSTAKPGQTVGDKTSLFSGRTCNFYAGSGMKADATPVSCFRHRKASAADISSSDGKDGPSSSLLSPAATVLDFAFHNTEKALKYGQESSPSANVPTSIRDKPRLGLEGQATCEAPELGSEKYGSCASSIFRHNFRKKGGDRREVQSSLKPPEIPGLECVRQPTSKATGDDLRECDTEFIESLQPRKYSVVYPSGNEPSQLHLSSLDFDQSSDAHGHQSRSPPSAPQTSATDTDVQLFSLSDHDGVSDRNISWRVHGGRGVLTEGSLKMDSNPSELNSEEEVRLPEGTFRQNLTETSSKDGNLLTLEVQIDRKNVLDSDHGKVGERFEKVNWELRLSKREAALRIAEEKLLEQEHSISLARLAASISEGSLRQREQDVQRESEKQKNDLGESLESIITGKIVLKKLCTGLKDVLWQLELKEKVLQSTWLELKNSVDTESVFGDHSFGFEPESSQMDTRRATFDGISFLVADGKREEWCSTVVGICERLVTYMNRETHLQKWAAVLEREGMRLGKMTKEIVNAKEAASEQCARSEDMMQCAEEQAACIDSERVKLAKERDNLILWISHLQERRKSVAECEMKAAKSLAEFQKKAADLFVHESNVDERALQVSAIQEELRVTSQRLQDDQVFINREKHKVLEKMRQVAGRDRELESKTSVMQQLQDDLNAKAEELEADRVDKKRKEVLLSALHEREERVNARELSVREIQKELEQKVAAVEERTNIVNDREKLLTDLQLHMEIERSNMHELRIGLEKEKVRLQEAEEAVVEAHCKKRSAEEAWARTAQERRESLRLGEDRLKQWEDELRLKEKEIQGQQKMLQEIEIHAREEQEHTEALHAKLVEEQDSWTNELKAKQENLSKRKKVLDAKEEEINNDLARLTEERNVALENMKRLAEMEARAWSAERDLQTKHDEHLKEVMNHASEYNSQVEDLASAKREVRKEFEEVRAKKQELKIWQREAEETLQNRIASFIKGKEELTAQIKELKRLQTDIEQAGAQIIDRVAELDLASTRLERQRYKVENSKKKLEELADKLATHQEVLKRRECDFLTQESKLVAVQNGLKKMATEAATREKNLRCREQAVIDSENDLHDVEVRLASEREDLKKMVAEVEQHAAELKEGTASVEEVRRSRTRNELMMEERRCKERELEELEKEAKCLEVHGETTSTQDMPVKERLQRSVGFEAMSEEVEKGWEQEPLNTTKFEIQKRAVLDEVQRQTHSDHDAGKRKRVKNIGEPCAREALPEACEPALIEDRFQYMEEKRKAAEAIAAVVAEREHRFKLQQHEFSGMEVIDSDKMRHRGLSHELHKRQVAVVKGFTGYEQHAPVLEMQLSGIEVSAGLANWVSKLDGREAHFGYQQSLVHKQMDRDMGDRLNVMEEALQKEASKISQERANLKLQQQDLEETKKAVEEVKLTLKAQLKATKQMVADATLTAQNASREREALEEERKRLAQDRKDAEASVALKEKELAIETIQLETTKSSLKQVKVNGMGMIQQHGKEAMCAEHAKGGSSSAHWDATTSSVLKQQNAKAMEIIQQARRKAVNADYSKIGSSTAQWDSSELHIGSQCEVSCKDSEKEMNPSAENTNVGERVEGSMLHEVPGEEHIQHHHSGVNGAFKANACLKDPENQMQWKETREGRVSEGFIRKANDRDLTFEGSSNSTIHIAEHEIPFSAPGGGVLSIGGSGDYGEEFAKKMHADSELANHTSPDSECSDAFDPRTSSINVTYNRITPEKMSGNEWPRHLLEVEGVPSRKRLENVMTSLMHARQASRSRLKRTEIALLAFSPSSGCITQVQQALDALSARLSLMEQIEEGLGSHLRNTYKTELPESERLLVDKVQLLSRMEEQQSVRAEWEEDMQRQLETISMLQAATSTSPNFCIPPRDPNQGLLAVNDRQNHSSIVYQDGGKGHDSHEILGSSGTTGATSSTGGEVTRPSIQYPNVKRINVHEPRGGFDPNGTFNSYFVAYEYLKNPADLHSTGLEPHGSDSHGRGARRKLLVSPPHVTFT